MTGPRCWALLSVWLTGREVWQQPCLNEWKMQTLQIPLHLNPPESRCRHISKKPAFLRCNLLPLRFLVGPPKYTGLTQTDLISQANVLMFYHKTDKLVKWEELGSDKLHIIAVYFSCTKGQDRELICLSPHCFSASHCGLKEGRRLQTTCTLQGMFFIKSDKDQRRSVLWILTYSTNYFFHL